VNPWLVAVIALSAALVALAAWVIVDNYTGGDSATEDATALIDDFNAAGSANDGVAAKAMMTPNVVLWTNGDVISGADAWANEITTTAPLTVERLAPVSVEGNLASTYSRFVVPSAGVDTTVVQVFQITDGKVARVWQFVPGLTPPFDNALPE
jgi:hypothetical protein